MIGSGPSSARPEWKPPWEAQVEKPTKKRKNVSFKVMSGPEVSVGNHGHKTPVLIGGLSADDNEIIVDWSSGTAKSNISGNTDRFVDRVVEKSRAELRARDQADDLLGKSTFTPPESLPPQLESVRIGSYQSSECK